MAQDFENGPCYHHSFERSQGSCPQVTLLLWGPLLTVEVDEPDGELRGGLVPVDGVALLQG